MALSPLLDVSRRMMRAGSGQDMYRTLVTRARRALGRGHGVSFFLVYRSSDLVLPIAESAPGDRKLHPEAYTQKMTKGILGEVVRSGKPYLARDVRNDPLFVSGGQTAGSELCLPVTLEGEVVAILNIESDRLDAFSDETRSWLEFLAEAAGALMNSGVAQEQQKALEAQLRGAEDAAAALEGRFDCVVRALDSTVVVVDADGHVTWGNGALAESVGKDFESLLDAASHKAWKSVGGKGGAVALALTPGKKKLSMKGRAYPCGTGLLLILDAAPAKKPAGRRK